MVKVSKTLGKLLSTTVGVAINTALTTIVVPFYGIEALIGIAPFVFLASLINGGLAYLVTRSLVRTGFMELVREPRQVC
jgi:hypothetical protein